LGGVLGVLFMIPLRRTLIIEDKDLIYPEGVACARVLEAGQTGGRDLAAIFLSLGGGLAFKALSGLVSVIRPVVEGAAGVGRTVVYFGADISVALLGVGLIVGLEVATLVFAGGAIGWLSAAGSDRNLLNAFDHGRLLQQSYYGGEDGSQWVQQPWRYNPVQGGDYRGQRAEVLEFALTDSTASVTTRPRHWASGQLLAECTMRQRVELIGPMVKIQFEFAYNGTETHPKYHQETPAMFVNPDYGSLVWYQGEKPWQDQPVRRVVPGWPNEYHRLDESWAAFVDDTDQGIGIYVPGVAQLTCYRFRGEADSSCSYVAPLHEFALLPGLQFNYDAYVTLGPLESIRRRFAQVQSALPALPPVPENPSLTGLEGLTGPQLPLE
jgi:hypothetical protein